MKCNNCGHNEAGFFRRTNINGHITETQLCAECADKLGVMQSIPMPNMLNDFFGGIGEIPSMFGGIPAFAIVPVKTEYTPRFEVLTPSYETEPVQTAAAQNVEVDEELRKKREINILREQMKAAASSEDFEKAMSLREEIKRLEA